MNIKEKYRDLDVVISTELHDYSDDEGNYMHDPNDSPMDEYEEPFTVLDDLIDNHSVSLVVEGIMALIRHTRNVAPVTNTDYILLLRKLVLDNEYDKTMLKNVNIHPGDIPLTSIREELLEKIKYDSNDALSALKTLKVLSTEHSFDLINHDLNMINDIIERSTIPANMQAMVLNTLNRTTFSGFVYDLIESKYDDATPYEDIHDEAVLHGLIIQYFKDEDEE